MKNTTARTAVSHSQVLFVLVVFLLMGVVGFFCSWLLLAQIVMGFVLVFIGVFIAFKFRLCYAARKHRFLPRQDTSAIDSDLPVYTIYAPMFDEPDALPSLLKGLDLLSYDKGKLQVLLLLETRENDPSTWAKLDTLELPFYVEVVVIPDRGIKNKPTALNVGLAHTKGEFAVIFDAEDRPDPDQLLKAVGTFREASDQIACLQARLRFSNERTSFVSRMLQMEYDIHFRLLLPGLAYLGLVAPLGGTSNHFRVAVLRTISASTRLTPEVRKVGSGAWDSYNVTEDAELAGRLYEMGFRIEMLDSITHEVATTTVKAVVPQRSRWQKGYIQTWLTYTRNIRHHIKRMGLVRWANYVMFLMGTTQSVFLSTATWAITVVYFVTRSQAIEAVFPWPLLYLGAFLLVVGNIAIWIQHVTAALKSCHPSSAKYTLGLLFWQQLATISHVIALWELSSSSRRSKWRKTEHTGDFLSLGVVEPGVSSIQNTIATKSPVLSIVPEVQGQRGMETETA